jgi:3-methyladenine DNA glycosylase/8-oxoguanine DNA glycosylase
MREEIEKLKEDLRSETWDKEELIDAIKELSDIIIDLADLIEKNKEIRLKGKADSIQHRFIEN